MKYKGLIILFVLITLAWFASLILIPILVTSGFEQQGQFGDMFGAINSLFSGFAFAGVIYAIFLQMRELKLQKEELILTRKELKGQKLQLKKQNETMVKQNFENTFFSLLRLHNNIVTSIKIPGKLYEGRDCFKFLNSQIKGDHDRGKRASRPNVNAIGSFILIYDEYQGILGHYFRALYNLFKLVDQSGVDNKKFYTNLVRAQLSNYELVILFYNCLGKHGKEKFKPLIERYAIFDNIDGTEVINFEHLKKEYSGSAFGP